MIAYEIANIFSQLLRKEIFLIGHDVQRWEMKMFVLAIHRQNKIWWESKHVASILYIVQAVIKKQNNKKKKL